LPTGVITFNLSLPEAKYPGVTALETLVSTLLARLQSAPGVESSAAVFGLPFAGEFGASTSFRRPGEADSADNGSAGMRIVTPDYFRTMKIPLVAGRLFNAHDDGAAAEVVLINERTAQRHFADRNPIGEQIHLGVSLTRGVRNGDKRIVGIVGNVKYGGLDVDAPAEIYLPYAQHQVDEFSIAVRAKGDPTGLAPTLRRVVASIDRDLPVAHLEPMTAVIGESIAERRFTMLMLVAFAGVAVALAAVGIYGVMGYLVGQRSQEIGVRLAIGASPRDVVRLVVRESAWLTAIGLGCGVVGSIGASRTIASLLFGVGPTDPATFAAVGLALALVALAASYLRARRAARIDPIETLRTD